METRLSEMGARKIGGIYNPEGSLWRIPKEWVRITKPKKMSKKSLQNLKKASIHRAKKRQKKVKALQKATGG